ncbi:hypothetical protein BWK57_14145 [Flavobacterium columnare]|uniref:hypothetical protein n=1 Tax=Flavobacterium columnare TaxID=996 RepID=UPI000CDB016E|nr:hypothetical protein [Flavobacterium columnare]POR17418.1 hypothetical protein BWK57_14145 [Flavobacterium columnare]
MEIKNFEIKKETEKAYLIETEDKLSWIPKSKINMGNSSFFIDEELYNKLEDIREKQKVRFIKFFTKSEKYNENTIKCFLSLKIEDYEMEKFMFLPISQIKEQTEEYIIIPEWIFHNSKNSIIEKEIDYVKEKYNKMVSFPDYEILSILEVI